jgi:ATP-dependent 26S proteasome regulatory subunit
LEEIDFIAGSGKSSSRGELFYTLVSELDSLTQETHSQVLIVATTSKMEEMDKSMRRGGRLDIDIRFDMPNSEDRHAIMKSHLS